MSHARTHARMHARMHACTHARMHACMTNIFIIIMCRSHESEACTRVGSHADPSHNSEEGAFPCECSGWGDGDLYRMEIVDKLKVPPGLPPGKYVLGWRWDWCGYM